MLGNYALEYGNARNSSESCLSTVYSTLCENGCKSPASCTATTGRCACLASKLYLTVSSDPTKQTCHCFDHPFVYYNGIECVNATGKKHILF